MYVLLYLIFSPTYNILVYLTFHELDVRVPLHPVNIIVVYLSPKQVVVLHSVRLLLYVGSMLTTRSSLSTNMVSKENVQDQDDASANTNKSPDAVKKVSDQAPPDTDSTLPVCTHICAIQAEEL